jgi:hypothetical protein
MPSRPGCGCGVAWLCGVGDAETAGEELASAGTGAAGSGSHGAATSPEPYATPTPPMTVMPETAATRVTVRNGRRRGPVLCPTPTRAMDARRSTKTTSTVTTSGVRTRSERATSARVLRALMVKNMSRVGRGVTSVGSRAMPVRQSEEPVSSARVRRIVLTVALLNLAYFFVELTVALTAGSVSLLADSVDFLEDTSVNVLVVLALGWPLARRAVLGKAMALIILGPSAVAGWTAIQRLSDPVAPAVAPLVVVSLGAMVVNGTCAWLLVSVRHHGGSLSSAAFLSARNDVLVNVAIIAMGVVTVWTGSGWPDLGLGCFIIVLALHSAYEIWGLSEEERLAARVLEP